MTFAKYVQDVDCIIDKLSMSDVEDMNNET